MGLDVTERKMCTQRYSDINFEKVPSCCLNKFTKAFLNETRNATELNDEEEITGNRYPNLKDRVDARKELQRILEGKLAKKINGKQLHPHEIVKKFLDRATSRMEGQLYQVQWNSIREGVEQSIRPLNETELPTDEINLGKLVPLVDVSGSMGGTPMEVAIAMGILISEVNHPAFQNRFLTFTDQPEWVTLHPTMSIQEKVHRARNAPWGYSTNFILAMELILKEVVDKHMRQEDIPDLIVFSDMQFDEATRTPVNVRETRTERKPMHEIIKDKFNAIKKNPPKIIYWNLRATGGHVVKAKEPNVMMLSGFSPAMLKLILEAKKVERETDEEEKKTETVIDENGNETVQPVAITPYKTMQLALRDASYDEVRRCLEQSEEGPFKDYPAPAIRIHSLP